METILVYATTDSQGNLIKFYDDEDMAKINAEFEGLKVRPLTVFMKECGTLFHNGKEIQLDLWM